MTGVTAGRTRSVLLVGATGLVGRECLSLLLADAEVTRVVVIARRPIDVGAPPAKLETRVVSFERLADHAAAFAVDAVICALGTTIGQAGSQDAFRRVDHDYPLEVARLALSHGARHFVVVSALGADARSRVFYNRVKGELEEALRKLGYPALTIVRPSLLIGERSERRLGEILATPFMRLAPRKYRAVKASDVARALVEAAKRDAPGVRIVASGDIERH